MKTKVCCISLPRYIFNQAAAVYDTAWNLRQARRFAGQLDEIFEHLREPVSLETYSANNTIYFTVAGRELEIDQLVNALYFTNITCEIREIDDYFTEFDENTVAVSIDLRLRRRDVLPIKIQDELGWEAFLPQVPPLQKATGPDRLVTQLVIQPDPEGVFHQAMMWKGRTMERLSRAVSPRFWCKRHFDITSMKYMLDKGNSKLMWFNYRIIGMSKLPEGASIAVRKETTARLKLLIELWGRQMMFLNTINENGFYITNYRYNQRAFTHFKNRAFRSPQRLSTMETSSLWYIPYAWVIPCTSMIVADRFAPPRTLPNDPADPHTTIFGYTTYRDQNKLFGVNREDRKRHFYILGKSGSGKSGLMQLLLQSDFQHGYGCAVLDPHGDLVDDLLKVIPKHRLKDVVLFDPSDVLYPPCFNPLSTVEPEQRVSAATTFVDAFRASMGADWTETMDRILQFAMLVLISSPGTSVLSLRKLLTDEEYRNSLLQNIEEERVLDFWQREYIESFTSFEGSVSRLLTRLDRLLATDMVRNVIGQPTNLFDFRHFMDTRKIVLIKVSKGILGSETAKFLGSIFISKVKEAAMSRADMSASARQDFYFYIDEFQNFSDMSFSDILSESRKYGLCLTFGNQYLDQLSADVRKTIFGNVGNLLAFRVGASDADKLADEFKPRLAPENIMHLATRDFYLKMTINGEVQETFSGRTLDISVPALEQQTTTEAIRNSRQNYCLPLSKAVEALEVTEGGVFEPSPHVPRYA